MDTEKKWLEISLSVAAEVAEAVTDVLGRFAPGGVAIEIAGEGDTAATGIVTAKAYLPVGPETARVRRQLEEALWHLGQISPIPTPTFTTLAETDWAAAWKEHFYPLRVGRKIIIKPSWREFDPGPDDIVIELDPGMAFGTGLHPTTQMCLSALEDVISPGMQVLDLGTGSGILALAAVRLGAKTVLALDSDPVAVKAAQDNVQRNGLSAQITVALGSLEQASGVYDLVVVNILAKVIIALTEDGLAKRVRPGGRWVMAGIIEPQAAEVKEALEGTGLQTTDERQIADWISLIGRR